MLEKRGVKHKVYLCLPVFYPSERANTGSAPSVISSTGCKNQLSVFHSSLEIYKVLHNIPEPTIYSSLGELKVRGIISLNYCSCSIFMGRIDSHFVQRIWNSKTLLRILRHHFHLCFPILYEPRVELLRGHMITMKHTLNTEIWERPEYQNGNCLTLSIQTPNRYEKLYQHH